MDITFSDFFEWCVKKPAIIYLTYKMCKMAIVCAIRLISWKHSWENNVIKHAINAIESDKEGYKAALLDRLKIITKDPIEHLSESTQIILCTELLKRWDHVFDENPNNKNMFDRNNPGIPWLPLNQVMGDIYKNEPWASATENRQYATLRKVPELMRDMFVSIIRDEDEKTSSCIADLERLMTTKGCWNRTVDDIRNAMKDITYSGPFYGKQNACNKYLQDNIKSSQQLLDPILDSVKQDFEKFRADVFTKIQSKSNKSVAELNDEELAKICRTIGSRMAGSLNHGDAAIGIASLYFTIIKNNTDYIPNRIANLESLTKRPKVKGA